VTPYRSTSSRLGLPLPRAPALPSRCVPTTRGPVDSGEKKPDSTGRSRPKPNRRGGRRPSRYSRPKLRRSAEPTPWCEPGWRPCRRTDRASRAEQDESIITIWPKPDTVRARALPPYSLRPTASEESARRLMPSQGLTPCSPTVAEAAACAATGPSSPLLPHAVRRLHGKRASRCPPPLSRAGEVASVAPPVLTALTAFVRSQAAEATWVETGRGVPDAAPKCHSLGERTGVQAPDSTVASRIASPGPARSGQLQGLAPPVSPYCARLLRGRRTAYPSMGFVPLQGSRVRRLAASSIGAPCETEAS